MKAYYHMQMQRNWSKMRHSINCGTHCGVCNCHFAQTSKRLVVSSILPEDDAQANVPRTLVIRRICKVDHHAAVPRVSTVHAAYNGYFLFITLSVPLQ